VESLLPEAVSGIRRLSLACLAGLPLDPDRGHPPPVYGTNTKGTPGVSLSVAVRPPSGSFWRAIGNVAIILMLAAIDRVEAARLARAYPHVDSAGKFR
jgi:hypothetical protein